MSDKIVLYDFVLQINFKHSIFLEKYKKIEMLNNNKLKVLFYIA